MKQENKIWYLKQVDLFKGIPDREIMAIASRLVEKQCKKKELLYTPFEVTASVYILKKGEITLYHLHKGKKLIIDVLHEGSIFGGIDFQEKKTSHFAEASEASYLCILPMGDFLKIIQAKPELMLRLLQISSERIYSYESKLKDHLYDAKEKILHQLDLLHETHRRSFLGMITGKPLKITHEKLAQHTGLTRETVTRALRELRKDKRIGALDDGYFIVKT